MNSFVVTFASLFVFISTVYSTEIKDNDLTKDEIIALTRDHFGRKDPDALLNGFFPVWAVIQFLIACTFLVIAILSLVCYILGCRTPPEERQKRKN